MWMGDHCMESTDDCMTFQTEFDCMSVDGCYWMGDHCMAGDSCTDPIAYNYNPIADLFGQHDGSCEYYPYINFGSNSGTIGYGFRSNGGKMEFKHGAGTWAELGGSGSGDNYNFGGGR